MPAPLRSPDRPITRSPDARRRAIWLFLALVVIYNANGREIGSYDSQPTKFTIRELAVGGTLTLDRLVAEQPAFAERPGFAIDRRGHYRSAYSLVPVLVAAIPAIMLHRIGAIDFDAPLAPNLAAALTASLMTAGAVTLVYLALLRLVPPNVALWTAIGLGLGTNYWTLVSQTLWQHESVALGLALALWAWLRPDRRSEDRRLHRAGDPAFSAIGAGQLVIGALGLAMAGAARPMVAPMIAVMFCWLVARAGWRRAVLPGALLIAAGIAATAVNVYWFGHPLGALPRLQEGHPNVHLMPGSLSATPWISAAGLLFSPSRGLLVFSPVVAIAMAGIRIARRDPRGASLGWLAIAAGVQFGAYSLFSVWWAGHTYGPRYLIDLLVPLAPLAALGAERAIRAAWSRAIVVVLLVWSIAVAAAGAFVYPHEAWNSDPTEIDRDHARLWDVRDSQIRRAFTTAPSPQNLQLLTRAAIRRP